MKKISSFLFFCLLCTGVLYSCKKGDPGPPGADGADGANGAPGINGNANVVQYTYGTQNLTAGFVTLQVTTTQDTMNNSAWYVYLYASALSRWYSVPGMGVGGATEYRVSMGYSNNKVNIYIDKIGPGESYSMAKVIRVYINDTRVGGRNGLPDFSSYETVRRYYGLPE